MDKIIERFLRLPLGNICDANGKRGAMDEAIRPVDSRCRMAGYAYTVQGQPGDNLALHNAMLYAPEESVIVADMGGYKKGGQFGELMATACQHKGISGLVIDGSVRDALDIVALGFPVFSRGICPNGTVKESAGELEVPVICGGIEVSSGDLIIGNIDGVVVVKREEIQSVLERAEAIAEKEDTIVKMLKNGMTTVEIYGFSKLTERKEDV